MGKRCSWIHDHGKKVNNHHEISQGRLSELNIQSLCEKSGYTRWNDESHGDGWNVGGLFHDGDRLARRRSRVCLLLWGISPICERIREDQRRQANEEIVQREGLIRNGLDRG